MSVHLFLCVLSHPRGMCACHEQQVAWCSLCRFISLAVIWSRASQVNNTLHRIASRLTIRRPQPRAEPSAKLRLPWPLSLSSTSSFLLLLVPQGKKCVERVSWFWRQRNEGRKVWFVGAAVVYTPPSPPYSAPHTLVFLLLSTEHSPPHPPSDLNYSSSFFDVSTQWNWRFSRTKTHRQDEIFSAVSNPVSLSYQTLWFFWDHKLYCEDDVTFSSVSNCTHISSYKPMNAFLFIITGTTNEITWLHEAGWLLQLSFLLSSSPLSPLREDMAATQSLLCPLTVLSSVTPTFYLCLSPMIPYLPRLPPYFLCFLSSVCPLPSLHPSISPGCDSEASLMGLWMAQGHLSVCACLCCVAA